MVVFLGDFNYRLHDVSYEEAMELISRRRFDRLREKDQLRAEMKAGRVFQGLREAQIDFPPTYKFERNQAGLSGMLLCSNKRQLNVHRQFSTESINIKKNLTRTIFCIFIFFWVFNNYHDAKI